MLIVWSGYGFLSAVIFVAGTVAGLVLDENVTAVGNYGIVLGLLLAAGVNWAVGIRFNNPSKDKELIDPKTGGCVMLRRRHTLFWIPMQYWSVLPLVLAVSTIIKQWR